MPSKDTVAPPLSAPRRLVTAHFLRRRTAVSRPPPPTPPDGIADDFFDQILSIPAYGGVAGMVFHLTSSDGGFPGTFFPLGSITRPQVPTKALHRERILERMRVLQELISTSHKVPSMSRLGVAGAVAQVPSMSRLGVAGAVAQAVADIPLASVEGESSECEGKKLVWGKLNNDMEQQVVNLMEECVGAAMQFLQSKALRMIPIFLATMIYQSHHQNEIPAVKLEPNAPS